MSYISHELQTSQTIVIQIWQIKLDKGPDKGCDRLGTSRKSIFLPRRRNFAGESIKNFRLLSTKLYTVGNIISGSDLTKLLVTL